MDPSVSLVHSFIHSRWRVVNVLKIEPLHLAVRRTTNNSCRKRNSLVSHPGQEKQILTWVFGTYECLVGLLLKKSCRILSDDSCNDVSIEKRWLMPAYIWEMAQDFAFPLQAVNRQEGVTYILPWNYSTGIFFHHILYHSCTEFAT